MHLPVEILNQVAKNLVRKSDMATAALVNWEWYSSFTPVLYKHVEITEPRYWWEVKEEEALDLPQMTALISVLYRNPYLSSLVHSIEHRFFDSETLGYWEARNLKARVEFPLRNMRSQLQEIIDRNGFLRVTKLSLLTPDIEIAGMLLRGLCPQLELLRIHSGEFEHLPFRQVTGLPSKLRELEIGICYESIFSVHGYTAQERALRQMHMDVNAFLVSSVSLRVLRIAGVRGLGELIEGVTLPHLHTLETDLPFSDCPDRTAECVASFLDRNLSLSRLAMGYLPDQEEEPISSIPPASNAGIRELVSFIGEVSIDYLFFLRGFTHISTFKLKYESCEGKILLTDLLEVMRHLHGSQLGVKQLLLPMPSENREEIGLTRDELSHFGMAFKDNLPAVEVFAICQVGKFWKLEAAEWAHALAGHPHLRKLAINKSFLFSSRMGFITCQKVIDEIAQEFSALPQLEYLVFPEGEGRRMVQLLIVRSELGVSGKAATVEKSMVDEVFFDPFFEGAWNW